MRKSISKLTLAATFGLALALTFSCSQDNDDVNNVPSYYHPDNPNNRCNRGVVEAKCGDVWYNASKYVCISDNTITLEQYYEQLGYARCGNSYYHPDYPDYYRCQSGVLEAKCEDMWYNTSKYVCINNNTITQEQYLEQYLEQFYEQNGYVRCR